MSDTHHYSQTSESAKPQGEAEVSATPEIPEAPRENRIIKEMLSSSVLTTVLAIVFSMLIGGILIAFTDAKVQASAGYFFARPVDTLVAVWEAVSGGYAALFRGAIYNYDAPNLLRAIKPLSDTLNFATPLIAAGLGVGLAFRVGLFNIGGRGQMLIGIAAAGFVMFGVKGLPFIVHMPLVIVAGMIGGAIWGGIVGILKARTGAHEVILTIMLNFVALYFVSWLLSTPGLLMRPGGNQPISPVTPESAKFPLLFGAPLTTNWGFVVVILAALFVWWLMERSALGFRMRAVGENPHAARAAGINVGRVIFYAMAFAGALAGLAGVNQVSGTITTGFGASVDAGIGFDAITVALLGRSRAWGVVAAGLLFGALKAGSFSMQIAEHIPVDIVLVVQALIVLFIAAPPLVRSVFGLGRFDRVQALQKKGASA